MKRIIWLRPDGGVSIQIPNYKQKLIEETEQVFLNRIANSEVGWVRVADLDEENLPKTREFRNAWTWITPDPVIDIDFDKAKEITKDRLRAERKPLLEALDVETMKNITNSIKLVEIEAQKQVLRDVTKKADECKTLDELKGLKAGTS